jgi:hypothetical protein
MKIQPQGNIQANRFCQAFSLVELMVTSAVGLLLLTVVAVMFTFGLRSFASMGNYSELDGKSRRALDLITRDVRQASRVLSYQSNATSRVLTLTNFTGGTLVYSWDAASGLLTCDKTGESTAVYLTGCDLWNATLFQRTPGTNNNFYTTADPATCKLINMSWRCSRAVMGRKLNTESVLTAQIVLRNKQ